MTGTGSFGTASTPLSKLFTERVVLDVRTTDPSSPEKGAIWFREDLDSGTEKFGELRWYDGSSTNGIPVFDKGTSGSKVEEVLGFKTADGIGFVPAIDRANATYPQLSLQHGGTTLGLHDSQTGITTVDSFEDGDVSEYGGDTGIFTVNTNSPVFDGTESLKAVDNSSNSSKDISSTSGLGTYPAQGDTFRMNVQIRESRNIAMLTYGVQTEGSFNDLYGLNLNGNNDDLILFVRNGGSQTNLASTNYSPPVGTELVFEVEWTTNGDHTGRVLDTDGSTLAGPISATDTTYTSGGVGVFAGSGKISTTYKITYDNIRIV